VTKTLTALAMLAACSTLALPTSAIAETAPGVPPSISTPDKAESRLGVLEFKDGAPNAATVAKIYDNLDYTHAFNAFNTPCGASVLPRCERVFKASG
jgi:hypothetical protein